MELNRAIAPAEILAIKAATRRAVKLAGGVEAFAAVTRIGAAQLSRCGSPDNPDIIAVDVAVEADREAGVPAIASAMAGALGFRLVRMEATEGGSVSLSDGVDLIESATGAFRVIEEALADGRLTNTERARIRESLRDIVMAAVRIERAL